MTATVPLVDVLPARESGRLTVWWYAGTLPGCGVVTIAGKRGDVTTYTVNEFPCHWEGRAFRFAKVDGKGTDPDEDAYCVFVCSAEPKRDRCDCRGFARHNHCRHTDAASTLIGNGWL